jgi:hypothetical protein
VTRFDSIATTGVHDQFPILTFLHGENVRSIDTFNDRSHAIDEKSKAVSADTFENVTLKREAEQRIESEMLQLRAENVSPPVDIPISNFEDPPVPIENVTLKLEAEQRIESEMLPLNAEKLSTPVHGLIDTPEDNANETTATSAELYAPHSTMLSWESSSILPQWIKEYIKWHQDQLLTLNEKNWDQYKYLMMRCLANDPACGGASDRLQSIPVKLRIAATSRRLLFIRWERPAKLEEFLIPPSMGFDWRLPDWLYTKLQPLLSPVTPKQVRVNAFSKNCDSNQTLVDTIDAFGSDSGAWWYDAGRKAQEADFATVYHEMWNLLLEPSPPVGALIVEQMNELQLQPMQYDALHLRMVFLRNEVHTSGLIENAMNCLLYSFGSPSIPLYVAADNAEAKIKATQYASTVTATPAVAHFSNQTTMHLDRGSNFRKNGPDMPHVVEPYYETFVDLYILSRARCIVYGRGSYGRWANLLSANTSCSVRYFVHRAYKFPPSCQKQISQES